MKTRNLIHKRRHEIHFTKEELFTIKIALKNEKQVVYSGSSTEEHEEHRENINAIIEQIKTIL